MKSDHVSSGSTTRYFMRLLVKHPAMDAEAKSICKGFLIRCENWDVKIQYSRYLTRIEVAESIFSITRKNGIMRWPTRSYTDKYERKNRLRQTVKKKLPNLSPTERENDELFQTAARLGEDFLFRNADDAKQLLGMLEVYRVFIL